jgi:type IV secretion system protein TrbL
MAALGGTAVAGGIATAGSARMAGRAASGAIKSAASLSGRVGAAYEAGGAAGVARATVSGPASRMAAASAAPMRTAYRHGAAQGYRDAAPSEEGSGKGPDADDPGGSASSSGPPPWAQSLARRQRMTQAGLMAAHALRDGDRAGSSSGPDLKNKT